MPLTIEPKVVNGQMEPCLAGTEVSIGAMVHACHVATIDQGLAALALPQLTRDNIEGVLQYCAELRCTADQATCEGCKRRSEIKGIDTLDQYILSKREIVVGDGRVRLLGQGAETVETPCLETLAKRWSAIG